MQHAVLNRAKNNYNLMRSGIKSLLTAPSSPSLRLTSRLNTQDLTLNRICFSLPQRELLVYHEFFEINGCAAAAGSAYKTRCFSLCAAEADPQCCKSSLWATRAHWGFSQGPSDNS